MNINSTFFLIICYRVGTLKNKRFIFSLNLRRFVILALFNLCFPFLELLLNNAPLFLIQAHIQLVTNPILKHPPPQRHKPTSLRSMILDKELNDVQFVEKCLLPLLCAALNGFEKEVVDEGVVGMDVGVDLCKMVNTRSLLIKWEIS